MNKAFVLLKNPAVLITILLNFCIVFTGVYYNFTNQDLLTRFTKEDGFVEWMQFLTFTMASLFMFFVTYERIKRKEPFFRLENLGIFALGFLFLFASLEEISWFQRIADIQAGEFFLQNNKQAETNLHNLKVGTIGINKLISKILFICLLTHNLILPLLSIKRPQIRTWIEKKGFFLPPLFMVFVYIALAIIIDVCISHSREKEHLEAIGAIHYFICAFLTYGLGYGYSSGIFTQSDEKRRISTLLAIAFVFLFYIAWILGNMSLKDLLL